MSLKFVNVNIFSKLGNIESGSNIFSYCGNLQGVKPLLNKKEDMNLEEIMGTNCFSYSNSLNDYDEPLK